ncbi:MAG: hypothetical protein H6Q43_2847, partial [Deltaproteobacteria bacterium]|nr:hypothetical protein [Deltaproteobacteria bacterium]
ADELIRHRIRRGERVLFKTHSSDHCWGKSISCPLTDLFTGTVYERKGEEMLNSGLYIGLEVRSFHFLKFWGSAEKFF